MNTKSRVIIALSVTLMFGLGLVYLQFSNLSISADQLTSEQTSFCAVQIGGKIQSSYAEKDSHLSLKLINGSQTLAETTPIKDKYNFSVSGQVPNDNWSILATDNFNAQQLQYPVVSLSQIKCDSTNEVNLQI